MLNTLLKIITSIIFGDAGMSEERRVAKKSGYMGFFSIMLSITIITAGLMWEAYGHLPGQYYLPVSFAILVVAGVAGYVILVRRIEI